MKGFVEWLFEFIFSNLHLDSTFAKRNQNLLVITTFIEIVGASCIDGKSKKKTDQLSLFSHLLNFYLVIIGDVVLFDFEAMLERKHMLTLIECLWDTYENNKKLALDLLIRIEKRKFTENVCNFINKKIIPN